MTEGTGDDRLDHRATSLIEAGSEIAGGTAGAAVGLLLAGPPGALAGAAAGPLISRSLRRAAIEIAARTLSRREQIRVGAALSFATEAFQRNLAAGEIVRQDDFFSSDMERNAADEVIEGVLRAAQREHEERKVRHLGYLMANIAFTPVVDRAHANRLIATAERMSYRQLCLLSLVGQPDRYELPGDVDGDMPMLWSSWAARRELADLRNDAFGLVGASGTTSKGLRFPVTTPRELRLGAEGRLIFELLELSTIVEVDLAETLDVLHHWQAPIDGSGGSAPVI